MHPLAEMRHESVCVWIGVGVRDTGQSRKEQPVRGLAGPEEDAGAGSTVRRGRDDDGE